MGELGSRGNVAMRAKQASLLILDDKGFERWEFADLMTPRVRIMAAQFAMATSTAFWSEFFNMIALLGRDEWTRMSFVPRLPATFARTPWFSGLGLGVRVDGTWRQRRVLRSQLGFRTRLEVIDSLLEVVDFLQELVNEGPRFRRKLAIDLSRDGPLTAVRALRNFSCRRCHADCIGIQSDTFGQTPKTLTARERLPGTTS